MGRRGENREPILTQIGLLLVLGVDVQNTVESLLLKRTIVLGQLVNANGVVQIVNALVTLVRQCAQLGLVSFERCQFGLFRLRTLK